jgi:GTP-binding protein
VPTSFISAKTGVNLKSIIPTAERIRAECLIRVGTGRLNRAMEEVLTKHQPPITRRARAKFFYLTQAETAPPTFVFFVNDAARVSENYTRYLEKSLRRIFDIRHAPMRIHLRSSHGKNKE